MRIKVGILGAGGMLGRHYQERLKDHPWFQVYALAGSDPSYRSLKELTDCNLIFSALPSSLAGEYEPFYAKLGIKVISSSSYFREAPDVPLLIPEVNAAHLQLNALQKKRGWKGWIVAKPNCSIQSFLLPLAPLHKTFEIEKLFVTTLQAVSGAGQTGLSSFSIIDNVIPFIEEEEQKMETEPQKILGTFLEEKVLPATFTVAAHCNRVGVLHGHMACVSVSFKTKPKKEDILHCWQTFPSLTLPHAPGKVVMYREEADRPQPRLDRDLFSGMAVTVGRLRSCSLLDWKFAALSHNVVRGGAGGGILCAELLYKEGYFA